MAVVPGRLLTAAPGMNSLGSGADNLDLVKNFPRHSADLTDLRPELSESVYFVQILSSKIQ